MNNVSIYPEFIAQTLAYGREISLACTEVWAVLIIIVAAIAIFKPVFFGNKAAIDTDLIVRAFFVLFLLVTYGEWMDYLSGFMGWITDKFPSGKNFWSDLFDPEKLLPDASNLEDKNAFEKALVYFISFKNGVSSLMFQFFIGGGVKFLRFFYEIFRGILIAFLYCTGPLAILTSMLPGGFRNTGDKWLMSYLNIQVWIITLNLLDALFLAIWPDFTAIMNSGYTASVSSWQDSPESKTMVFYMLNIIILICYLLIPLITAFYFPKGVATSFMSKVISTGAMATMAAASVVSAGATLATSGTPSLGGVNLGGAGGGSASPGFSGSGSAATTGGSPSSGGYSSGLKNNMPQSSDDDEEDE